MQTWRIDSPCMMYWDELISPKNLISTSLQSTGLCWQVSPNKFYQPQLEHGNRKANIISARSTAWQYHLAFFLSQTAAVAASAIRSGQHQCQVTQLHDSRFLCYVAIVLHRKETTKKRRVGCQEVLISSNLRCTMAAIHKADIRFHQMSLRLWMTTLF